MSMVRLVGGAALVLALLPGLATAAQPDRDQYIVSFRDAAAGKSALRAAGARVVRDLPSVSAAAAKIPARALDALARNPHIEYIEQDAPRYPLAERVPYGIPMVQADQLGDAGAGNRKVCIIDSGYQLGHEDLMSTGNVTGSADGGAGPWYQDGSGHGTHVAGTVAAVGGNGTGVVGVLPGGTVNLHIVRVFGDDGAWAYSSGLVAALDQCEQAGANVVSMSLGGSFKSRTEDRAFAAAHGRGVLSIAAAGNDGSTRMSYPASYTSVVSVAAVDSNKAVAAFSQKNSQVELAAPGVGVLSTVPMGTGSLTELTVNGSGVAADAMDGSPNGSGTGPLVDCGLGDSTCSGASGAVCLIQRGVISFAEKVQACEAGGGVAAVIYNNEAGPLYGTLGETVTGIPSAGISQADGEALAAGSLGQSATLTLAADNYAAWDGTSMATPHVSGVAALVWSQNTSCSNDNIRQVLRDTAQDLGAAGRDDASGYGLVQAAAAASVLDLYCGGDGGGGGGGGECTLLPSGSTCTDNGECCSGSCKGKPGNKTCK